DDPVTKIFYFSSTGNSLTAARKMAEKLGNTEIISIPKIINKNIDFSADRLVVVFPVYMWGLPNIVSRFLEKIQAGSRGGIFAVATYAGLAGDPFKKAESILSKKGLALNAGFLVWMPENCVFRYPVWPLWLQNISFRSSERKVNRVCVYIQNNKKGALEKSHYGINWFLTYMHKYLMNMIYGPKPLHPGDYFWTDEKCD